MSIPVYACLHDALLEESRQVWSYRDIMARHWVPQEIQDMIDDQIVRAMGARFLELNKISNPRAEVLGFGYLKVVPLDLQELLTRELGAWPTLGKLMQILCMYNIHNRFSLIRKSGALVLVKRPPTELEDELLWEYMCRRCLERSYCISQYNTTLKCVGCAGLMTHSMECGDWDAMGYGDEYLLRVG